MVWFSDITYKQKCTVIESLQGGAKLIKRSNKDGPSLVTLSFQNLKDCLKYADKNRIQINIVYSAKRKESDRSQAISENESPLLSKKQVQEAPKGHCPGGPLFRLQPTPLLTSLRWR